MPKLNAQSPVQENQRIQTALDDRLGQLRAWEVTQFATAGSKDHLSRGIVSALKEAVAVQENFSADMQHLKNMLLILSASSPVTDEQQKVIDKYLAKIDKLVELQGELNERHPLIVNKNTSPEDVIKGLNEKYNDPKFYTMMETLASLEFDREKINAIAEVYEKNLISKNADYRKARTTLAPILNPNNPERGTQKRDISTFTIMPTQNLPRISMVVRAVNEQLTKFRDSAPDYYTNEEGIEGPNVALQTLIAQTEGCVQRSGPKNSELQRKIGEKTVANLVDALYANSDSGANEELKKNFFLREILHLNLNTPLANTKDARTKDFSAYLETVFIKCYPEMFGLNLKEELSINAGTNNARYMAINSALGMDVFAKGRDYLNPANFNPAKLDLLYKADHNILWLFLKSTKPIDPNFTAEDKVKSYIDLAKSMKNQKHGEKEHAEIYKLAQAAIAIAQDYPESQTLVHESFGTNSELGQWLISKQSKQDQASVRENLSQFSHAKFVEAVQPPSHKKIVISPSQALLLLIEHYQNERERLVAAHADPERIAAVSEKAAELKKLYLVGVRVAQGEVKNRQFQVNQDDLQKMQEYLADPLLSTYTVSKEKRVINNDPTRRYFETHLSYETVKNNIDGMSKELLERHVAKLTTALGNGKDATDCADVFSNTYQGDSKLHLEYANYLAKIQSKELFSELNDEQRQKIILVVKSSLLGVANALARGQELPLNIYNTAPIYGNWRGKEAVQGQETTENAHMGLMKNYMPMGQHDIATSQHPAPPVKPSDQSTYKDDGDYAKWVELNFAGLVHPFSNAISGTMLCQLRNLAEQKNGDISNSSGMADSAQQIEKFAQVFVAAMLYGSGGHSLNEYVYPLQLQEVRDEFAEVEGFNDINLETLFLTKNEESFEQALHDAVIYNGQYLQRQRLNQDVTYIGAYQNKTELAKAIHTVTEKVAQFEDEVGKLWFSKHRTSPEQLEKMKSTAEEITKALKEGNVKEALKISEKFLTLLEQDYGKTKFTGRERVSYRLAKEMHETILALESNSSRKENIINANQNFKERMQEMKASYVKHNVKEEEHQLQASKMEEDHHRIAGL